MWYYWFVRLFNGVQLLAQCSTPVTVTNARFPPFRCRSSVAVSPFYRCKIPLFYRNYVRKFRSVTAVNSKKIRNGNGVRKRQRRNGNGRTAAEWWKPGITSRNSGGTNNESSSIMPGFHHAFCCRSSVAVSPFPLAVAVSVHRCRCRCVSLCIGSSALMIGWPATERNNGKNRSRS